MLQDGHKVGVTVDEIYVAETVGSRVGPLVRCPDSLNDGLRDKQALGRAVGRPEGLLDC